MKSQLFAAWKKHALLALAAVAVSVSAAVATAGAAAETTVSEGHTPEEIIRKWEQYKPSFNGNPFLEQPQVTAPHKLGKLDPGYVQDGVNMANFVRYLAGLPDNLVQDDALNEQAQYGAVLLAARDKGLSHYPDKPEDMDDAFYEIGRKSTSSSNLFGGLRSTHQMVLGYMSDSDSSNIDRVGHRRWILNPPLVKVGFGYAISPSSDSYSPMQVFDRSGQKSFQAPMIAWPSPGAFPTVAFENGDAWSVTLNPSQYRTPSGDKVKVTLKRINDGREWTFDQSDNDRDYFNVDGGGYGAGPSIIFRPANAGLPSDLDEYEARIEGIETLSGEPAALTYKVSFFHIPDKKSEAAYLAEWRKPRQQTSRTPVSFRSATVEERVRYSLGIAAEAITEADLARISDFYYSRDTGDSAKDEQLLSKLTGLVSLDYHGLTSSGVPVISKLARLKELSITAASGSNRIAGLETLSNLTQLQSFSLYGHIEQKALAGLLAHMPMLRQLTIESDAVVDLSFIPAQTMASLESLTVRGDELRDVSALSKASGLRILALQTGDVPPKDMKPILALSGLQSLELNNMGLTNTAGVEKMTGLKSLSLYNNQIRDISPLAALTQLVDLNVGGNRIRDISVIGRLQSLKWINVSFNGIHDITPIMEGNFDIQQLDVTANFLDLKEGNKTKLWLSELEKKPTFLDFGAQVTGNTAFYDRQQKVKVWDVQLADRPGKELNDRYMLIGESIPAKAIVTYNDYDDKVLEGAAVTWKSSDPDVVAVKNGALVAQKRGYAYITLKAGGVEKSFSITVMDKLTRYAYYDNKVTDAQKKQLESMIVLKVNDSIALVRGQRSWTSAGAIADRATSATLLPVRFVSENFEAKVNWNNATQTVTIVSEAQNKQIVIKIGDKQMRVNGATVDLPVPARTVNGTTYLPLRALCDALGQKVAYDNGVIAIASRDLSNDKELLAALKAMFALED